MTHGSGLDRRSFLFSLGAGLSAGCLWPFAAGAAVAGKKLVVLELSGGNDGLNTVIPYADDAYYRHRPKLGIRPEKVRKIDDHYGLHPAMAGFERVYKEGKVAVVHGCGYADPSFSHFTSMAYWHTAAPNSGEELGWVGRLADAMAPEGAREFVVNIDASQSLAVRGRKHQPVVFDDPVRFARKAVAAQRQALNYLPAGTPQNASRRFLQEVAASARSAASRVREAWADYDSPVDYGLLPLDLPKVVSLIAADMPTQLYYTSFRNNAFDTHVYQSNLHGRLLTYASDAIAGFFEDLRRIGRSEEVVMLVFSEFGRRVPENTNLGTDHGAAGLMFVIGDAVKGGHYGEPPSLVDLDPGDNLLFTTDFRRVYATVIEGFLGIPAERVLGSPFETFPMFS
ncbi:MAG: DUF1501 domain-containing protein [Myxococcales bacterium]|nr:DUF1501 domain-containing protein [Myxococcales bacterium]